MVTTCITATRWLREPRMSLMKLTDLSIKGLKAPPTGQRTYPDDSLAGFGVRVSQGGTRSFVLVHGKSRERTTIGRYPIIKVWPTPAPRQKRILAERTLGHSRAASAPDTKRHLVFTSAIT